MTGNEESASSIELFERLRQQQIELEEKSIEIQAEINRLEAQVEQARAIQVAGLYNRMESMIKTLRSSMSDPSIGEVFEYEGEERCVEAYARTINVEISARKSSDDCCAYTIPLDRLPGVSSLDDATLVVSYLIPFNEIEDDPFFAVK